MVQVQIDPTDQLIEMMQDAEGFDAYVENSNPDATRVGQVISNGTQTFPAAVSEISHTDPETGGKLGGTGYRYLYNTRTGERIEVHRNNYVAARRKKHRDPAYPAWIGKLLFSVTPTVVYERGHTVCILFPGTDHCNACGEAHPAHPDNWLKLIPGLVPCLSAHLANDHQAERHAQGRHAGAWAAIKTYKETQERQADRTLREKQLAA